MPNTREKLIELLTDRIPGCDNELRYVDDERVERLADHLIANGVTVKTGITFECKYVDMDGCPQTIRRMIKAQTNADRIRAMSDEELAVFLADDDRACPRKHHNCRKYIDKCDGCWFEWLQQPAEVQE